MEGIPAGKGIIMGWDLKFITEEQLSSHVAHTIEQYKSKLQSIDLAQFNKNIVDPVKMLFDRAVYGVDWKTLLANEIFRQRDKSNTNEIGYFHQGVFAYLSNCKVPEVGKEGGWDVIYTPQDGYALEDGSRVRRIYVEMKNKHNTMNYASSAKTYIKMQAQLLSDDSCACFLVEAIAKRSQNIPWQTTVDGNRVHHARIRRVSIDQFYAIITGEEKAFYQLCSVLPSVIEKVVHWDGNKTKMPKDTVYEELREAGNRLGLDDQDQAFVMALYMLGFGSYWGFKERGDGVTKC